MTRREPAPDMSLAALSYARRGWRVFPCRGKHPRIKGWQHRATTDAEQIRAWWRRCPSADIAIATGAESGIYVLDVDVSPERRGDVSLIDLVEREGPIDYVAHAITGTFGDHYYMRHPGDRRIPNGVDVLGPGLDIRGDGGYVIAPPSRHPNGHRYEWGHPC